MGGSQSKETVVSPSRTDTSIRFSPDLLSQLSGNLESTSTSPEREESLDKHVRERIKAELAVLQTQEEEVKHALKEALQKENLGREINIAADAKLDSADETKATGSRGTASLREDIEAVKRQVDKYAERRKLAADTAVEQSRQAVLECYKKNSERPLDCWKQVEEFRMQVASVEGKFVESLK